MEREEFVKQFKVGDNIMYRPFERKRVLVLKYIGKELFLATRSDGLEYTWVFNEFDWLPYKEPKKMIKVYQYAFFRENVGFYEIGERYFKDMHDILVNTPYGDECVNYKRLDHTMIEVEDY